MTCETVRLSYVSKLSPRLTPLTRTVIDSGNGALSVQEDDGPMVTGREIADVEPDLSEYPKPVLVRETNRPAGI